MILQNISIYHLTWSNVPENLYLQQPHILGSYVYQNYEIVIFFTDMQHLFSISGEDLHVTGLCEYTLS